MAVPSALLGVALGRSTALPMDDDDYNYENSFSFKEREAIGEDDDHYAHTTFPGTPSQHGSRSSHPSQSRSLGGPEHLADRCMCVPRALDHWRGLDYLGFVFLAESVGCLTFAGTLS